MRNLFLQLTTALFANLIYYRKQEKTDDFKENLLKALVRYIHEPATR